MVIVVILIVLGAIYGITVYQSGIKTQQYLADLSGDDTAAVVRAIDGLSGASAKVANQVAANLTNDDPQVRSRAIMVMGNSKMRDTSQVASLLDGDEDIFVRRDAAVALGKLTRQSRKADAEQSIGILVAALQNNEENIAVRAAAASALGVAGAKSAVSALSAATAEGIPVTPEDPEAEAPADATLQLRTAAANALGSIGTIEAIQALHRAAKIETEPTPGVRAAAAYSLGNAALVDGSEQVTEAAIDALVEVCSDEDGDVRIAAVHALGTLSIPESKASSVQTVLNNAASDEHYWVRAAAAEAMKNIGPLVATIS